MSEELDYLVRVVDPQLRRENPIPYGENEDSSSGFFIERKKFEESAYAASNVPEVVDMLGSRVLFGRIDLQGDSIVPSSSENFLSFPNNDTGDILTAINFVANAFEDFRRYYNTARLRGKLVSGFNEKIFDIQPYYAYDDPNVTYNHHFMNVAETIPRLIIEKNRNFLKANALQKEVKNFNDFMNYFETNFLINNVIKEMPITKCQYVKSRYCSIRSSGLIIEIDDAEFGEDNNTYENYITDINFEYYVKTALKFGFRVDKNAPWRLIPDFNSDEMKAYMTKYGIGSLKTLFNKYYRKPYQDDIEFLKKMFFDSYKKLLNYSPVIKENKLTCNRAISRLFKRKEMSTEEYSNKYDDTTYWINWYVKIRLREMGAYSDKRYVSIIKNYSKVKNILDKRSALRYINDQINSCKSFFAGSKANIGSTQNTY